jgi:hypothetical protein
MFDTRVAKRGSFTTSLPVPTVGYGVTDDFTVGAVIVPTTEWPPHAVLNLRYRLYSHRRIASVVDLRGGGMTDSDSTVVLAIASSNTSYRLTSTAEVTAGAIAFGLRRDDRVEDVTTHRRLLGVTLAFDQFFTNWLGGQLTVVAIPWSSGEYDFSLNGLVLTGGADFEDNVLWRGLVLLKPGRTWLIAAGALSSVTFDTATGWTSVTKRW